MTISEPAPNGGSAIPADQQLTLFAEVSPVSLSASPATGSRRKIAGGSGRRWLASFASYDPATSSWKTFRVSLDGEWETYSETWPPSGMTQNGTAYRRPTSVPPIYVIESGLLPTPSASDYGSNQGGSKGRVGPVRPSLQTMARRGLWPTPKGSAANYGRPQDNDRGDLQAAVLATYPTPAARDHKGRSMTRQGGKSLPDLMGTGQLNPEWV